MAASLASKVSKETKPKPRLLPESGSRMILGVLTMTPKAEKVSYSSFSSTSASRLPTKMLAPTSSVSFSREAWLTRMGLPKSLIMFNTCRASSARASSRRSRTRQVLGPRHTFMAYCASSSALNSTKPKPMCCCVSLSLGMCTFATGPHCRQGPGRGVASAPWLCGGLLRGHLHAELPQERLGDLLVQVADVARRLLVAVVGARREGHRDDGGRCATPAQADVETATRRAPPRTAARGAQNSV